MAKDGPVVFDPHSDVPDSVVYDIFAAMATRLGGKYIYLADHSDDSDGEEYWLARSMALRDEKRAVDPDDRAALVEHVNRWQAELNDLRNR